MSESSYKYPIGPIHFKSYDKVGQSKSLVFELPNGSSFEYSIDEDGLITAKWISKFPPSELLAAVPYIFEHNIDPQDICYRDKDGYIQEMTSSGQFDEIKDTLRSFWFGADFNGSEVLVEFSQSSLVHVSSHSIAPIRAMAELCCDDAIYSRIDEMVPNGN
jgi:hypothetical protein